jgi:probable HAF family extracellular repeat protein
MTDLGTLGGRGSQAEDIADNGAVAGSAQLPDETTHAVLWSDTEPQDLGGLPGGSPSRGTGVASMADGVNEAGVVVGWGFAEQGAVAARWGEDGADLLTSLAESTSSRALDINDSDLVVGHARVAGSSRAVLWAGHGVLVLDGRDRETVATAVNDVGTAVGWAETSAGGRRAVAWPTSHDGA